jgi:DNA-binding CsgD family transcriptional regulator
LVLTALLFLPGTVTRCLISESAYLASGGISAFASFGNGAELALITGCFYSLVNRKRTLWAVLSTIAGIFVFYLIQGGNFPLPVLFTGIGLVSVIGGVFILVFLAPGFRPENEELGVRNEKLEDHVRKHSLVPTQIDTKHQSLIPNSSLLIPNFLFPLLAVFVIFSTSTITDRLFSPSLNYPFDSGFNPFVVAVLVILTLFGFLAAREWERFLRFFIFLCAGLFAVSPSLLFFNRSETIFMILYTLNITATRMMTAVFPFVLVDSYWQDISSKDEKSPSGFLAWFLAVSVYSINLVSLVLGALFKDIQFDNAYAVLVLSLAAIVFFVLCLKVIPKNKEIAPLPLNVLSLSIDDIFREHNLSERETEVALLMVREGLSNEEMGERLFISIPTVKSHVSRIYRKFGVKSRAAFLVKVKK